MRNIERTSNDVREVESCWIPLADGVRLSARLWLPVVASNAPAPAILEYIPYRKRDMVRARDERNHPYFARHGYVCVRVDMRGSGDSEGLMNDMYTREELDDAIEVIDWIARQPWCDGSVGMMGISWGGTSSLQAAARQPGALKAIIAVCATNDRFDDDIHHMGGCLLTDTVEWGATLPVILASPPDPETAGPDWRGLWRTRLEGLGFPLDHWIRHEARDAYWRWGAAGETPDAITCPVLAIGGWSDRYSNTVMNLLARSHDRCWGVVGPWGHHFPDIGCPGPGIGFQQEAVRWWDRWLKGKDNGVDEEPRLRVWLQEYVAPESRIARRRGRWISETDWPSGNVMPREFRLASGRLQSAPGRDDEAAAVPSALAVGSAAGDTGYFGREGGLPLDQRKDDALSLVFETEPLEEPLAILGAIRLTVSLASDQPVATLVARLNDVPQDGAVARVAYTVRNLALDDNGVQLHRLTPGEVVSFDIEFPNTAYRFEPGHRIRLAVSSSYWPLVWPSPKPARITLHLADARLTLPVRQAGDDDMPVSFAQPLDLENSAIEILSAPALDRWMDVDMETNRSSTGWRQPFKCVRLDAIDLDFGIETRAAHTITLDSPTSASSRLEHRLHYRRGDWTVEVSGTAELTSTHTAYVLSGATEVCENGEVIFRREWSSTSPRICS